ncbi:MAG: hypothetical protein R3E08_01295 [Thiotrichaceae bacterium]
MPIKCFTDNLAAIQDAGGGIGSKTSNLRDVIASLSAMSPVLRPCSLALQREFACGICSVSLAIYPYLL